MLICSCFKPSKCGSDEVGLSSLLIVHKTASVMTTTANVTRFRAPLVLFFFFIPFAYHVTMQVTVADQVIVNVSRAEIKLLTHWCLEHIRPMVYAFIIEISWKWLRSNSHFILSLIIHTVHMLTASAASLAIETVWDIKHFQPHLLEKKCYIHIRNLLIQVSIWRWGNNISPHKDYCYMKGSLRWASLNTCLVDETKPLSISMLT